MSNKNKWKEFCSQQDTCEKCKYNDCDCEIEFWKDWAREDERAKCETCIHKVTKADIDAIENTAREKALDELENKIAYEYYDGGYGDYHEVEMIVRMIHEMKAKKEQK